MKKHDASLGAIVAAWFVCSVITECADKLVMMELSTPLTLALWKFAAAVPFGIAAVIVAGRSSLHTVASWMVVRRVLPLAAMIVFAKLLTYISYRYVPLSTAQIVKAATPIVTVAMARVLLNERFGLRSYASLVPIAIGVCCAVGLDVDVNALGIAAALTSCVFAAGQSIYMKKLFIGEDAAAPSYEALSLNLLTASCCALLLLPVWLGVQMHALPASLDGNRIITRRFRTLALRDSGLWVAFTLGALTQWAQSVCAYLFLERVSPATSVVVGTARKPFIVVVSVAIFAQPVTLLNVFGIVLAFAGVFSYTYARYIERQRSNGQTSELNGAPPTEGAPLFTSGEGAYAAAPTASSFAAWYEVWLARRPLLVKAVTSGVLYGTGDFIAQAAVAGSWRAFCEHPFDSARFARAVIYGGVFYPPLAHAHFNFLEYLVVVRWNMGEAWVPWVKMAIEQFVYWSYFSNAYYHVVIGALQGLSPLGCLHRVAATLWPTMKAQWALWVPAQVVNFKYVPVRHQLNFVLILSLVWTTFLSLAFQP